MGKTTFFTFKQRLSFPIRSFNMGAFGTLLRGVPRVYILHLNSKLPRLVIQICLQPRKAPGMDTPFDSFSRFHSFSNVCQIFEYYYIASKYRIYNSLRNNMITIIAEAVNLSTQGSQMPFCRLGAFRLKRTFQSKISVLDLLPVFFTKKFIQPERKTSSFRWGSLQLRGESFLDLPFFLRLVQKTDVF